VGFELEFTGLSLSQASEAVIQALGGEIVKKHKALHVITVDDLGEFQVELDWNFLKKTAEENPDADHVTLLRDAASLVVPIEVVCPPIAITALHRLDPMVSELRRAGAQGTDDSLLAAFGVHVNAALPALDADTIHRHIKAFSLLQWWLVRAHDVNFSRRITPYIDLYPEAYVKEIINTESPDISRVFDSYLKHNATRNRALDMLPLLAHIDEEKVKKAVDDERIKARPTFHYRLPNCAIDDAEWDLSQSWNLWVVVERLACQPDLMDQLGKDFIKASRPLFGINEQLWIERIDECIKSHALA
jgi:hypothetical protein